MNAAYPPVAGAAKQSEAPAAQLATKAGHARIDARVLRIAALAAALLTLLSASPIYATLPRYFFYHQDLPVLAAMLLVFAAIGVWKLAPASFAPAVERPGARAVWATVAALALAVALVGIAGHSLVLSGYALSRDEQLTLFDAEIFAAGRIVARLPQDWRAYGEALNTIFIPESMRGHGWVSMYRPVNAAIHLVFARLGSAALASPVLAAVGLLATWRVARRVLPDDRESQLVAVLLYATSVQVMANAMTSYAMTGHLALNMVWLALLLHGRWYSHLAAIAVGFLAIGLHQIVYHPLFAGPFLLFCVLLRRQWGWSAVYAIAYAAGILFWSRYTAFPLRELGVVGRGTEVDDFILTRIWWALSGVSLEYLWIQCANLARFFAWQNLLLLPLLVAGTAATVRSRDPRLIAMIAAIAVLVIVKLVLRPYQGHGWGFRYMHGLIGVACIVAAAGWARLRARRGVAPAHLAAATLATLCLSGPWLLWQAHAFSERYARLDRAIASVPASIVIVDDAVPEFTADLVYNPPFLDRRPVRLLATRLAPADMAELCRRGPVALVDARDLAPITRELGLTDRPFTPAVPRLRDAAMAQGCRLVPLAGR